MPLTSTQTAFVNEILMGPMTISQQHIGNMGCSTWSDQPIRICISSTTILLDIYGQAIQARAITSDWATAVGMESVIVKSGFLYALFRDAGSNHRVYRYTLTNIAAGGTLMTISGTAFGTSDAGSMRMISDTLGTTFYFNYQGGNSASAHILSKYTLSGTTLTFSANVTCGSTSSNFTGGILFVDASGNIWGWSGSDAIIRKYNSSGTLQTTGANGMGVGSSATFYQFYLNSGSNTFLACQIAGSSSNADIYVRTELP